jgi:hypothetical protein
LFSAEKQKKRISKSGHQCTGTLYSKAWILVGAAHLKRFNAMHLLFSPGWEGNKDVLIAQKEQVTVLDEISSRNRANICVALLSLQAVVSNTL